MASKSSDGAQVLAEGFAGAGAGVRTSSCKESKS